MSEPTISIQLSRYVALEIGHREFAYIDATIAGTIKSIPENERYCVVENGADYVNWLGEALSKPSAGLYRLWTRAAFDLATNNARRRAAERATVEAQNATIKQQCAELLHAQLQGMATIEQCVSMLGSVDINSMKTMLANHSTQPNTEGAAK